MVTINVYDKSQVDAKAAAILPSTSGASANQVLGLDANLNPAWIAASSGNTDIKDGYIFLSYALTRSISGTYRTATITPTQIQTALQTMLRGWSDGTYSGRLIGTSHSDETYTYCAFLSINITFTISNGTLTLTSPTTSVNSYKVTTYTGSSGDSGAINLGLYSITKQ